MRLVVSAISDLNPRTDEVSYIFAPNPQTLNPKLWQGQQDGRETLLQAAVRLSLGWGVRN